MTGPFGSSAAVPNSSLMLCVVGTPNNITDFKPLRIRGSRKGISLFRPRRYWLGKDGIRVSSSGWSDMKSG